MTDYSIDVPSGRLVAACRPDLAEPALSLLRHLAQLEHPRVGDGVVVEFGWAPLRIIAQGRELRVHEPDFAGSALTEFVPQVDTTLRVIAMQTGLLRPLGLTPVATRFDQKIVGYEGCLLEDRLRMQRERATRSDESGWRITPPAGDEREVAWCGYFAYQIAFERLNLMAALALPPGHTVCWNGWAIEQLLDPQGRNLWNDPPPPAAGPR